MANAAENLQETLKPFHQRAAEAEERLARLEAALAIKKEAGNDELLKKYSELQSKVEEANAKLELEQKKAKELTVENEKHKYRIEHLVRALKAADQKLEQMKGQDSEAATDQTTSRLKDMEI